MLPFGARGDSVTDSRKAFKLFLGGGNEDEASVGLHSFRIAGLKARERRSHIVRTKRATREFPHK